MNRPCECDRFVVEDGFAEYVEGRDCRRCYLFHTNPEVNQAWGGDGKLIPRKGVKKLPRKPRPIPLPCIHEGKPVPPPPGKDVRKRWWVCEAGKGIVSQCSCNPRCNLYEPDSPEPK